MINNSDELGMKDLLVITFSLLVLLTAVSCESMTESPIATKNSEGALLKTGDIVVTSNVSDSAIVLDKNGNFKRVLYNADNSLEDSR